MRAADAAAESQGGCPGEAPWKYPASARQENQAKARLASSSAAMPGGLEERRGGDPHLGVDA